MEERRNGEERKGMKNDSKRRGRRVGARER